MSSNTFGALFRVTTFGESHGPALGCVVDGVPAGLPIDLESLERELARRRPGQSGMTTPRSEADAPEILSGVLNGVATGAPIAILFRNLPDDGIHGKHRRTRTVLRHHNPDFRGTQGENSKENHQNCKEAFLHVSIFTQIARLLNCFQTEPFRLSFSP